MSGAEQKASERVLSSLDSRLTLYVHDLHLYPSVSILEIRFSVKRMNSSDVAMTDPKEVDLPANRFELELEFVQCLASPAYLHHLATTGILGEPSFIEFLEYLQYWKKPEYVRLLQYPHCLFFLDLLIHNPVFRRELANVPFRNFIHEQQFYNWQHRARKLYGQGLPAETP